LNVPKQMIILLTAGFLMMNAAACGGNPGQAESSSADSVSSGETGTDKTVPETPAPDYDTDFRMADPSLGYESLKLGWTTDEMIQRAVLHQGNRARLANVMKRAENGEEITFGVIGGSITNGTGASNNQENYAYRTMAWWCRSFPKAAAKVKFVNAGIGATGSYIGVHRAERDLLSQNPDVVIVEFSVNDTDPTLNFQSYDSLVRKILNQPNQPAVVLLFMTQDNGTSLVDTHRKIGEAYDLPMISYKNAVLPEIEAGRFAWSDISPDNIHPNSNGHGIAAELLWQYFNSVRADLDQIDTSNLDFAKPAISEDRYQEAEILNAENIVPDEVAGFEQTDVRKDFPGNWKTETAGEITFTVDARNIGVLYQRTVEGKSGQYDVFVDGNYVKTLNGNFGKGWGNYAEADEVFTSDESRTHVVTIKMAESSSAEGFILLGLLKS